MSSSLPRLALADQIRKLNEATTGLESATAAAEATIARLSAVETNLEHDKLCHVCGTKIGRTRDV